MKYAVVRLTGKQYKVKEGQELVVDKIVGDLAPEVLLVVDSGKVNVGNPTVKGASIKFSVEEAEFKGKKVVSMTYKAKARIRKVKGMRPQYSRIKVEKIII